MSVHQLDSFSPPSDASIAAAKAAGVEAWPGYIGGPEAATQWPADGFARIRAAGLRSPGIYVGLGSGGEAVTLSRQRGIPAGEVIWHDVETQWSMQHDTPAQADAWVATVKAAGYQAGLYGTASFVAQYGSHYDVVWAAGGAYYRNGPGSNPWPADATQVPGCSPSKRPAGVQWWATHDEPGLGIAVDRSIMDDHFGLSTPNTGGDDPLDVPTAQYLAFTQFALGVGRPPSVVDMQARGQRILDIGTLPSFWEVTGSPEGVSSGGLFGKLAAQDARLAAVEAHLASIAVQGAGGTYDPAPIQAEIDKIRAEMVALHAALAAASTATQ